MKKIVFVTGVAGFIGFHVARALHKRGDKVIGLDNFNSYYSPALKYDRARLLKNEGVAVIEGDICDRELMRYLFDTNDFTHTLHLAAQAGVRHSKKSPDSYLKSNLEGFLSLLETCKQYPSNKLVYASSSSVYGCNDKIPFSETHCTDFPTNLYAATKKANELMAFSYHHLYGISMTALRYFTVYGPWGRPDMAYYSFAEAILQGKPIQLFNEGKMRRDFTYIDDIVKGTLAALDLGASWEIFNLGNNSPTDLLTFVALMEKELGIKAEKIFEKGSPGEVETTFADIQHAKKYLNFSPSTSLLNGLPQFLDWLKSYMPV